MYKRLAIAMFVDACGWDVVARRPWFLDEMRHRQSVKSIFGFSSACVPSILTGRMPQDNDHWSCFYYSPSTSPFRPLRLLQYLPSALVDRGRIRRYLSKAIASAYGYTGYFQIYNLPFDALSLFDYAEKKDIFKPGGINRGTSIFDDLERMKLSHHVSNWRRTEERNFASLRAAVQDSQVRFAFLYTGKLDAIMHDHTRDSKLVDAHLRWYESRVRELMRDAADRYDEVRFAMFSDHGMATVRRVVDLSPRIEGLGLRHGTDYAAVFDSTMLRFWFLKPHAGERIRNALRDGRDGTWLDHGTLARLGAFWPDRRFGDAIYALEPGVLMNPSHMGKVPMAGMHGYRPDHPDSDSALVANFAPTRPIERIPDYYRLMLEMAGWAKES